MLEREGITAEIWWQSEAWEEGQAGERADAGEESTSGRAWPAGYILQESHRRLWRVETEARFQTAKQVEGKCSGDRFGSKGR